MNRELLIRPVETGEFSLYYTWQTLHEDEIGGRLSMGFLSFNTEFLPTSNRIDGWLLLRMAPAIVLL